MYARTLLPGDKSDLSGIEALKQLPEEDFIPVIPELLTWLQDVNWPVAEPVTEVLAHFGDIVEPYIIPVLSPENDDGIWKYNIIAELLPKMPGSPSKQLFDVVMRIAENPTVEEKNESVHEAAQTFIDLWNRQREKEAYA